MEQDIERLKYPVGKFQKPETITKEHLQQWINVIETFPGLLRSEVIYLTEQELEKSYRPGGWTIRQVVHHCADSHMNSYMRFKLALTEETPTIKPYFEDRWAELADSRNLPVEASLKLLEGLHARWVYLIRQLTAQELERQFHHPESNAFIALKTNLGIYAWHCRHHLAHVQQAKRI